MAKVKIRRADPPQVERRDYHWAEVAKQLRASPGEWFVIHENLPSSVPGALAKGAMTEIRPQDGFEFRTAGNTRPAEGPRMTAELFARYVPSKDESRKNGRKR
jgi:hypothetical protein